MPPGDRELDLRSARILHEAIDKSGDAFAAFSPSSGKILRANPAFAGITGVSSDQLEGQDFFYCLGEVCGKALRRELRPLLQGRAEVRDLRLKLEIPLHPPRPLEARFVATRPTPRRRVVCAYLRDIAAWDERVRTLEQETGFLRSVIHDTLQAVFVTNLRGEFLLFNRGAQKLLGYSEEDLRGRKTIQELCEGDAAREVLERTRSADHGGPGLLDRHQTIMVARNRERIPVWLTVRMLYAEDGEEQGTVAFVHDMRDVMEMERRLEEVQMQLIHADKMASLGKLAAGVAHEINNPLGGILLFGGLLLEDMDFSDPRREDVDRIVQEARRCKEIVNSLLDFAHQKKRYHEPVDMNAAVEQCMSLLGNKALFHNVEVSTELAPGLPLTTGNPSQIKQVFTNIVTNAVDAMDGEGRLTIRSGTDADQGQVWVSFNDTGPGMPPTVRNRIFDPFFTTKEPGKGTGLGLSLSYNIIRMHRGDIRVHCPKGGGTTFTVALPLAEDYA